MGIKTGNNFKTKKPKERFTMQPQKIIQRVLNQWVMLMCAMLFLFASAHTSKLSAITNADSVVFQNDSVFTIEGVQEELKSDGEWIKVTKEEIDPEGVTDRSEGTDAEINTDYVWRPTNVEEGWSPYTNGYWVYTNCSWMWVSYYSWGWRTCHYGRWWWSDRWGWVWSPGFVFAPAWVVWMYNDGYCGWYPISPWVRYHHDHGYWCHHMRYRVRCWTHVEKRHFADPVPLRNPVIDPSGIKEIVSTGSVDVDPNIGPHGVNTNGPSVGSVEDATGKKIQKVNDVGMYNNTGKYPDTKDAGKNIDTRKKIDEKVMNNTGDKTDGNNSVGNKTTGTEKKSDDWYNNNKKNEDPNKNDGVKKNDGTGSNNEKKKDGGKEWNTGNNGNGTKQYTPPKQDPPKQYDPPKQEQPKQDPPKKNNDNGSKSNDGWKEAPPTKNDDGNSGKKK